MYTDGDGNVDIDDMQAATSRQQTSKRGGAMPRSRDEMALQAINTKVIRVNRITIKKYV